MRKGDFRIVTEVFPLARSLFSLRWSCSLNRCVVSGAQKLDGDLEGLIHDTDKPLSLYTYVGFRSRELMEWCADVASSLMFSRRMCMVRDIALGMNWLHNTKPAIIHRLVLFRSQVKAWPSGLTCFLCHLRDLKLGNVLYRKRGNWYEIKVSDFGTSSSSSSAPCSLQSLRPLLGTRSGATQTATRAPSARLEEGSSGHSALHGPRGHAGEAVQRESR
jgi:hypothetical protein